MAASAQRTGAPLQCIRPLQRHGHHQTTGPRDMNTVGIVRRAAWLAPQVSIPRAGPHCYQDSPALFNQHLTKFVRDLVNPPKEAQH
jgi:hypothetical protein